jgi:hypothetical protein
MLRFLTPHRRFLLEKLGFIKVTDLIRFDGCLPA